MASSAPESVRYGQLGPNSGGSSTEQSPADLSPGIPSSSEGKGEIGSNGTSHSDSQNTGSGKGQQYNSNIGQFSYTSNHSNRSNEHDKLLMDGASPFSSSKETCVVFKERWRTKEARIRQLSPIGHLDGWHLVPVIVKSNDDLRQEQCASQLIALMHDILKGNKRCGSGLRPYQIIAMSPDSGLIEAVPDTVSLHALRAKGVGYESLLDFFEQFFGPQDSPGFLAAQKRFIKSLADYCIACYLLQIKDRHNGNMLLTTKGSIIHIDFGFLLGE